MQPDRAEWMPAGLCTASEIATMLDVRPGTIKGWQRDGRLTPRQYVIPPQGGSAWRFYAEEDARALAAMRDYRAPLQRISAIADEVASGATIADAIHCVGVSRTTWNYWVRHRKDAAAVAAQSATMAHAESDAALRATMVRVLAAFGAGAPICDALTAEGLGPTQHQKWLEGLASAPSASLWFAAEYNSIVRRRRQEGAAEREAHRQGRKMRSASSVGWVYFVTGTERAAPIKIGWTMAGIKSRLEELQVGSPVELRSLLTIAALGAFEGWCHRQFADDRLYGEWFRRTPRMMGFIDRLASMGDVSRLTPTDMAILLQNPQTPLFGGTHGPTP